MKRINIILLLVLLSINACNNGNKKQQISKEKLPKETIRYCYLKKIVPNNDRIVVQLDFIDYKKIDKLEKKSSDKNLIKLPNGFCFINDKEEIKEVELFEDAIVTLQTYSFDNEGNFNFNQKINLHDFIKSFNSAEPKPFKFSPYKISIINNKIKTITEVYIP